MTLFVSIQKVLMAQIQNLSLMRFFYNMRPLLCVFDERYETLNSVFIQWLPSPPPPLSPVIVWQH